jgi:hypothetical protein
VSTDTPSDAYGPTEEGLAFARDVLSHSDDELLTPYLIGVIRSLVGMGDNPRERPPAEMVRMIRAALVAYDERRER